MIIIFKLTVSLLQLYISKPKHHHQVTGPCWNAEWTKEGSKGGCLTITRESLKEAQIGEALKQER